MLNAIKTAAAMLTNVDPRAVIAFAMFSAPVCWLFVKGPALIEAAAQ